MKCYINHFAKLHDWFVSGSFYQGDKVRQHVQNPSNKNTPRTFFLAALLVPGLSPWRKFVSSWILPHFTSLWPVHLLLIAETDKKVETGRGCVPSVCLAVPASLVDCFHLWVSQPNHSIKESLEILATTAPGVLYQPCLMSAPWVPVLHLTASVSRVSVSGSVLPFGWIPFSRCL